MTSLIDTLEPQRHPVQTIEPTSPQHVLERPAPPSVHPAPEPESERSSRPLGWVAALARHLRQQWDADVLAASTQAWDMMSRCSTKPRR